MSNTSSDEMQTCSVCKKETSSRYMSGGRWSRAICIPCKSQEDEYHKNRKTGRGGIGNWVMLALLAGAGAMWYFKVEVPFAKPALAKASAMLGLESTPGATAGGGKATPESTVGTSPSSPAPSAVVTTQTSEGLTLNFRSDVLFEFGSASLKATAADALRSAAATIRQRASAAVVIRGYTDSIGTEKANLDLSLQRAQAVKNWIVKAGVPAQQLSVLGMGAKDPVAPNTKSDGSDNPAGREQNRRVTITIIGG